MHKKIKICNYFLSFLAKKSYTYSRTRRFQMIREEIKKQLIEAMKAHQQAKVGTLRLINAAIKDKDIEDRTHGNMDGIKDEAILLLFQSMIKQRRDSIASYQQGARADLVAAEQAEIDLIQSFMPQQMSAEE